MIEAKIDFTKVYDLAWKQSLRADARPTDETSVVVSYCMYSGDVSRKEFKDILSEKPITFD